MGLVVLFGLGVAFIVVLFRVVCLVGFIVGLFTLLSWFCLY